MLGCPKWEAPCFFVGVPKGRLESEVQWEVTFDLAGQWRSKGTLSQLFAG